MKHLVHCLDMNTDLLFMYEENGKDWAEWYDAKRNRVEAIDTARPSSMGNISEEEDAELEEEVNARLREIAMEVNAPAVIYDSEGRYMGYDADEEEAKKMKAIVLEKFWEDWSAHCAEKAGKGE